MQLPERNIRICYKSEESNVETCIELDFKELAENIVVMTILGGATGFSTVGIESILVAYLDGDDKIMVDSDVFTLLTTGIGFIQLSKDGVNATFKS